MHANLERFVHADGGVYLDVRLSPEAEPRRLHFLFTAQHLEEAAKVDRAAFGGKNVSLDVGTFTHIADNGNLIFGERDAEGRLISTGQLIITPDTRDHGEPFLWNLPANVAYVEGLAVDPEFQGRQCGKVLMTGASTIASAFGKEYLSSAARVANETSTRLLLSRMTGVAVIEAYYGRPDYQPRRGQVTRYGVEAARVFYLGSLQPKSQSTVPVHAFQLVDTRRDADEDFGAASGFMSHGYALTCSARLAFGGVTHEHLVLRGYTATPKAIANRWYFPLPNSPAPIHGPRIRLDTRRPLALPSMDDLMRYDRSSGTGFPKLLVPPQRPRFGDEPDVGGGHIQNDLEHALARYLEHGHAAELQDARGADVLHLTRENDILRRWLAPHVAYVLSDVQLEQLDMDVADVPSETDFTFPGWYRTTDDIPAGYAHPLYADSGDLNPRVRYYRASANTPPEMRALHSTAAESKALLRWVSGGTAARSIGVEPDLGH
jgi:hypothetical protein